MLRLLCRELIRIGAVFRCEHMHGQAAAFDLAADVLCVIIAHVVQPDVGSRAPELDGLEAQALLRVEEVV